MNTVLDIYKDIHAKELVYKCIHINSKLVSIYVQFQLFLRVHMQKPLLLNYAEILVHWLSIELSCTWRPYEQQHMQRNTCT